MPKVKRGRKRTTVRNISQTPVSQSSSRKRPSSLPSQYNFTPADHIPPPQSKQAGGHVMPQQSTSITPHVRDYPPLVTLYQDAQSQKAPMSPLLNSQPQSHDTPRSPLQNSQTQSHLSSQGNNFQEDVYVDRKTEKIFQNYEKKLHEKLSHEGETSFISDGASRTRELTTDEYTAIFPQDSRGILYGVGSLKDTVNNLMGKRKQQEESTSFVALQEQLKKARRIIEEQAALEAEHSRMVAEQNGKLQRFSLVEEYLRQKDPAFMDFVAAHSAHATVSTPPAS